MNVLVVQTAQEVGVSAVIEDASTSELFDPDMVKFYIVEPDDNILEVTPDNPTPGVFVHKFVLGKRGTYGVQVLTGGPDLSAGVNVTAGYRNAWSP